MSVTSVTTGNKTQLYTRSTAVAVSVEHVCYSSVVYLLLTYNIISCVHALCVLYCFSVVYCVVEFHMHIHCCM